jgi:hypothetical protein
MAQAKGVTFDAIGSLALVDALGVHPLEHRPGLGIGRAAHLIGQLLADGFWIALHSTGDATGGLVPTPSIKDLPIRLGHVDDLGDEARQRAVAVRQDPVDSDLSHHRVIQSGKLHAE